MSSFRFSLPTFRSLSARLTFWVMLTVMIVTVIIAVIVSYISSSAVLMGTKENVQSRMEIANQHINSVLVGVEVAVANTIDGLTGAGLQTGVLDQLNKMLLKAVTSGAKYSDLVIPDFMMASTKLCLSTFRKTIQ